jgi:diguanylate cyclase (GGDEF)-like protein
MQIEAGATQAFLNLQARRREQTPQALARITVVALFIAMWGMLWLAGIPMPVPFLLTLVAETIFLLVYWRAVFLLPDERGVRTARACMLGAEIVFHTTMVYFLGGIIWLGAFAYVFGLIFTNTFMDLRGGFIYTSCASAAFVSLIVLEATGVVPHYVYGEQGPLRYQDPIVVITTAMAGAGVFFSIYLWVNWVGHQLRVERDHAVEVQAQIVRARQDLVEANSELERRVQERTGELELANAALSGSEELLRSTVESTADGILVVDGEGKVAFGNRRFAHMWRIPDDLLARRDDDELIGFVLEQLDDPQAFLAKVRELYQSDREDLDTLLFNDGRVFERYSRPLVRDGAVDGRVWSFRDVSERKRFEAQLVHVANHDPLTGLFNRRRFDEELERQLSEAQRYGLQGALLFLDLDQFKDVNDSRGHRAGDDLLTSLALLLQQRLRDTDVVARLGGDEFAILLPHADASQASAVAKELLEAIRVHTFVVGGAPLGVTVSLGIALFPEHGVNAGELLSRADMAMYRAKEEGRNRASVFAADGDWQAQVESRIGWHQRIREALDNDLFVLHAQPILDLVTDEVSQYELLLRMLGPDGEVIAPSVFLDIAERSGLIQDIDRWVVRRAIEMLADHRAAGRELRLEVNLSGKAFADRELLTMIQSDLMDSGVDPANLVLEVTETAAIANITDAQKFVRTLQAIGCGFALDDFGVGFSSFSQLKHLPVDYLKIDGSFVQDLAANAVDQRLVQAIVSVARGLGKKTIAEFVGDAETVRLLKQYGVDYAQGYHIAQPAPLATFEQESDTDVAA